MIYIYIDILKYYFFVFNRDLYADQTVSEQIFTQSIQYRASFTFYARHPSCLPVDGAEFEVK